MPTTRRTSILFALCASLAAAALLHADRPDPRAVLQAQQDVLQQIIAQVEGSIAGVDVARGEPYEMPSAEEPGRLGKFPSGPKEREAAKESPHLDLAHVRYVPEHSGGGVVIGEKGLILVPAHLVRGARKVYVRLAGGRGSYADIYATDPRSDLAVLRLLDDGPPLKPITLGDARRLRKGHFLIALGYPRAVNGGGPSAWWGILSNTRQGLPGAAGVADRTQATLHQFGLVLQTDHRLPADGSGRALVDMNGALVGLTTNVAAVTPRDAAQTFALPITDTTQRLITALKEGREVEYGYLGVDTVDVPAGELRVPDLEGGAVRVSKEVLAGTPAARAGLRVGDIILSVDGERVRNGDELFLLISTALTGGTPKLRIVRDGLLQTIAVPPLGKLGPLPGGIAANGPGWFRGLQVDHLTTLIGPAPLGREEWQERVRASLRQGGVAVRAVRPETPAARAGVQAGDVITQVNRRAVADPAEFARAVQALKPDEGIELTLAPVDRQSELRVVVLR